MTFEGVRGDPPFKKEKRLDAVFLFAREKTFLGLEMFFVGSAASLSQMTMSFAMKRGMASPGGETTSFSPKENKLPVGRASGETVFP